MLSYPIPEATELLTGKLGAARQSLSNCEEDLDFLREQITVRLVHFPPLLLALLAIAARRSVIWPYFLLLSTINNPTDERIPQTMEVATARVYNWDVGQKRKEKEAEGS